ncbi:MAG: hypothetical protein OEV92_00885 [Nitrospinota bacterium]|nr:hypothetical protein [Nitrospinota bacterium]
MNNRSEGKSLFGLGALAVYIACAAFIYYFIPLPVGAILVYAFIPALLVTAALSAVCLISRSGRKLALAGKLFVVAAISIIALILPARSFIDKSARDIVFRENYVSTCVSSLAPKYSKDGQIPAHMFCNCIYDFITKYYTISELERIDREISARVDSKDARQMAELISSEGIRQCSVSVPFSTR